MNKPEQSKELKALQKLRKLITTLWGCPHTEHVRAQAEALQIVVSLIAGLDSRPAEVRLSISDAKIAKQALELYDDIEINGLNVGMDFLRVAATLTRQLEHKPAEKAEKPFDGAVLSREDAIWAASGLSKVAKEYGPVTHWERIHNDLMKQVGSDCQLDAGKGER